MEFDHEFLKEVAAYHIGVQRPSGTFFVDENVLEPKEEKNEVLINSNNNVGINNNNNDDNNNNNDNNIINDDIDLDEINFELSYASLVKNKEEFHNSKKNDSYKEVKHKNENKNERRAEIKNNEEKENEIASYLQFLSSVDREICHRCGGRRQIYCGDCGGVRLNRASSLLPQRVVLPFDVLLIVHW